MQNTCRPFTIPCRLYGQLHRVVKGTCRKFQGRSDPRSLVEWTDLHVADEGLRRGRTLAALGQEECQSFDRADAVRLYQAFPCKSETITGVPCS